MNNTINIKASIISGISEVILTHPIDYVKTIVQNKSKLQFKDLIKGSYKGLSSRLIGIVPMRILFWNSLEYFKAKGYGVYKTAILTSVVQTTIDYPIEQIKTQKIINNVSFYNSFRNIDIIKASGVHLLRNIGFTICVNYFIQKDPNSLYFGAVGGLFGSLLTHPFDTLKTWYQTGNYNYPVHRRAMDYMRGFHYRCSVSLISMNIGWIVFHRLKELKK